MLDGTRSDRTKTRPSGSPCLPPPDDPLEHQDLDRQIQTTGSPAQFRLEVSYLLSLKPAEGPVISFLDGCPNAAPPNAAPNATSLHATSLHAAILLNESPQSPPE